MHLKSINKIRWISRQVMPVSDIHTYVCININIPVHTHEHLRETAQRFGDNF